MASGLINATTTPDYNVPGTGYSGTWSCEDWMTWYTALVAAYGVTQAQTIWLNWWNGQSELSENYHTCAYQTDFATFLTTNNIGGVGNLASSIVTGTTSIVSNLLGTASSATGAASNLLGWVSNNIGWISLVVIIIALGLGIWWFYARHIKT